MKLNFKEELDKRKLTRYAFADKSGLAYTSVSRWYKGGTISKVYLNIVLTALNRIDLDL